MCLKFDVFACFTEINLKVVDRRQIQGPPPLGEITWLTCVSRTLIPPVNVFISRTDSHVHHVVVFMFLSNSRLLWEAKTSNFFRKYLIQKKRVTAVKLQCDWKQEQLCVCVWWGISFSIKLWGCNSIISHSDLSAGFSSSHTDAFWRTNCAKSSAGAFHIRLTHTQKTKTILFLLRKLKC